MEICVPEGSVIEQELWAPAIVFLLLWLDRDLIVLQRGKQLWKRGSG